MRYHEQGFEGSLSQGRTKIRRLIAEIGQGLRRCSALVMSLLLMTALLFGCAKPPHYEVDSYQQVQADLAKNSGIIFPNLSKYEARDDIIYLVNLYPLNRRIKDGYSVYFYAPESIDNSILSSLEFACLSLDHPDEDFYSPPKVNPNTTYRTTSVEFYEWSATVSADDEQALRLWPIDTYQGCVSYAFNLNGYWYKITGYINLTPDELKSTSIESATEEMKAELLDVVDSILDQGGLPL